MNTLPTYKFLSDLEIIIINAMSSHFDDHNRMIADYLEYTHKTSNEMTLIVAMFKSLLRSMKMTSQFRTLINQSNQSICPFNDLRFLRSLAFDALIDYDSPTHLNVKHYPNVLNVANDINNAL